MAILNENLSFWLGLIACIFCVGAAGCSTPAPIETGRKGFFQRLASHDGLFVSPAVGEDLGLESQLKAQMLIPAGFPRRLASSHTRLSLPALGNLKLDWPLPGFNTITSPFGKRARKFHEGIDLRAAPGTTVLASLSGKVAYAGTRIRGYGKMIIIGHGDRLSTLYAHNSRLLVRVGQIVQRGQKIALSGNTGRSTAPHLHFEMRQGSVALDPLAFLKFDRSPLRPVVLPEPSRLTAARLSRRPSS